MLDPKLIRETPDAVRAAIAKKHLEVDLDAVLAIDAAWRALLHAVLSPHRWEKTIHHRPPGA